MAQRGLNKNDRLKTSWNDLLGSVSTSIRRNAWTTEVYRDTDYRMDFLSYNQDDEIHMRFQLSHSYELETNMKLHVHAIPMTNTGGNVYWEYQWFWGKIGIEVPALSGWNSGTIITPVAAEDRYKEKVYNLLDLTNANESDESSILRVVLIRRGTDVNDTYSANKDHGTGAANFAIDYLDCHFKSNKIGSDNELPPFNN